MDDAATKMKIERRSFLKGLAALVTAAVALPRIPPAAVVAPATKEITKGAVLRDPNNWYHLVVQFNADAIEEVNVNGNPATPVNTADVRKRLHLVMEAMGIKRSPTDGTMAFWVKGDEYVAEMAMIEGQALGPDAFGEHDPKTGVWQPKRPQIEYGRRDMYIPHSQRVRGLSHA